LSCVIERMLARDPARRYASCEEVAAALADARASAAGAAPGPGPATPERHAPRAGAPPDPRAGAAASRRPRHMLRGLAAIGVTTAAVAGWLAAGGPAMPHDRVLALLAPATPGASPEFAAFSLGSMELLASRLQRHQDRPEFQLAPFSESGVEGLASVTD